MQLVPAILAETVEQAQAWFKACAALSRVIHVDVLDDSLVPGRTLLPNELPDTTSFSVVWHLMVRDVERYLATCAARPTTAVFVHAELGGAQLLHAVQAIHAHQLAAGIVLNPETPVALIEPLLPSVAWVQVMTVEPGRQGAPFVAEPLGKLRELQSMSPRLKLAIDGGVDAHTIHSVVRFRPDMIAVGHYLAPGPDLKDRWRNLRQTIR